MQPHPHTIPTYGTTVQYAKAIDASPVATNNEEKYIRQVIGILLYYGQAVNSTILVGLSSLVTAQAKPTKQFYPSSNGSLTTQQQTQMPS